MIIFLANQTQLMTKTILTTIAVITVIAASITASSLAYAAPDPKQKDLISSFFDVFTQRGYTPNSFFDVFTELQTSSARADSFFDVFYRVFPETNNFFDVFTELRQNDMSHQTQLDSLKSKLDQIAVDSFFDITYRIELPGMTSEPTEIIGYSHPIVTPIDPASGSSTGKRQHAPIVIVKEIDKSTPLLFKALVNNEEIDTLKLSLYMADPSGGSSEQKYFTVTLKNAYITSITKSQNPLEPSAPVESISFVYQKIIWESIDGGVTAEDEWNPR